ncbi:poly(U)-specific 3'-to-5' RNA exonuclease [Myotisia sp. PD_48]|nr:poly(U)-specific 3'-to-5' RNA exonuclease [Myotisia sp. PD_48]
MPLVQYSDSESEDDNPKKGEGDAINPPMKRDDEESSLPPLPAEFRDLYSTSVRASVQDDPSLHDGRARAIPHIVGNWPTHIYLEWYPNHKELQILSGIISTYELKLAEEDQLQIHSLLYNELAVQLPLHISLSRPVVLLTDQRQRFLDLYQDEINTSGVRPFRLSMKSLDWVSNSENTRWFLVIRVTRPPNDELNRLLDLSNIVLAQFNQTPLYNDAARHQSNSLKHGNTESSFSRASRPDCSNHFHISIAWSLMEPSAKQKESLSLLDLNLSEIEVFFKNVKIKIGNHIHSEALPAGILRESYLGGI